MSVANILAISIVLYFLIGIVFGLYFVFKRAHLIDPAAKGTGFFFRVIILFGSVAVWPALIGKSFGEISDPVEKNAHRAKEQA